MNSTYQCTILQIRFPPSWVLLSILFQVEKTEKVYLSPETVKEIVGMGITPTDDSFKYTYQYHSKDNMYGK